MAVCDNKVYHARNTKVYIEPTTAAGVSQGRVWEVPVLDGFSFSQATNSSEITLAEMESATGVSRRGKRMFNDSLAPTEWSLSTYVRPFVSAGTADVTSTNLTADNDTRTRAVEEVLWALFMGPATFDATNYEWEAPAGAGTEYQTWSSSGQTMTMDFSESNKSTVGTANIYFKLGEGTDNVYYKITGAVVNEATINFDIDGIAMIEWSGMGSTIAEILVGAFPTVNVTEAITSTTNFIRNRLTSLTVAPVKTGDATGAYTVAQEATMEASYDLTLTGGSIAMSNNITYITPEELGIVNVPFAHVTGARSISGSFTTYLVTGTGTDQSSDFWEDILGLTTVVTHDFALTFNVGGASGDPRLGVAMPGCHIDIPTHSIEDTISLETNFTALGTCIEATDEATLIYFAT